MEQVHPIQCIGIIMDGNRRWAKSKNLPSLEGHRAGYKKMQEVVRYAREANIPHVVAYAFSTENWQRSEEEVGYLMKLFRSVLEKQLEELIRERVRIRFIGDRARFSNDLQTLMKQMEEQTSAGYDSTLHLLMSYGGRAEIVAAANTLIDKGVPVTETSFTDALWTNPMPDPDIIIRTGGEMRLSNFLPWQSTYSELFFTKTLWPDFSKEEFDAILMEFSTRERRHGK